MSSNNVFSRLASDNNETYENHEEYMDRLKKWLHDAQQYNIQSLQAWCAYSSQMRNYIRIGSNQNTILANTPIRDPRNYVCLIHNV